MLCCHHTARSWSAAAPGSTSAVTSQPARPFFMLSGWLNTSRAPASRRVSNNTARSSGVASSIWACCCSTVSCTGPAPAASVAAVRGSASTSRSRLGRSKLRLPRPTPTWSGTWPGARPKRSTQQAARASPVGVVSSAGGRSALHANGMARRRAISSTAGAGSGSTPWAVRTLPWPAGGGVHTS